MNPENTLTLPGDPCSEGDLTNLYSRALAKFLNSPAAGNSAKLVSCQKHEQFEIVTFEVNVVLPQYPQADIRERELIACCFDFGDNRVPGVYALRKDFPTLPHQNLLPDILPKSLCLSTLPWSEDKLRWSPSTFLESIRGWLSRAATNQLHAKGQPREPLLLKPEGFLILPSDFEPLSEREVIISGDFSTTPHILWAQRVHPATPPGQGRFHVISFEAPSREHGLIKKIPTDLVELVALYESVGFDLKKALISKLQSEITAGKVEQSLLSLNLLFIIYNKVTGIEDRDIESSEEWAFMISDKAIAVAEALGVVSEAAGFYAPILAPTEPSENALRAIKVMTIATLRRLNPKAAREASGIETPYPAVAVVGAGALGSKCLDILARQGLAKGVIIDSDTLFPHNTARHILRGEDVGISKAPALAKTLNNLFGEGDGFSPIVEKLSFPATEVVKEAFASAEFVLDFSASVEVSRTLAFQKDHPRCLSAFLSPSGYAFFIHIEDRDRKVRLDWIEAINLRGIVEHERLRSIYTQNKEQIWYGGACREVSTILPNQNISMFAAACAGIFTSHHSSPLAKCLCYAVNPANMALEAVEIEVTEPFYDSIKGWEIRYDQKLIDQMRGYSDMAAPNETGGVLFGIVDRERMTCSIVMASSSPPDSEQWPNAYIRGKEGLRSLVENVSTLTAGQLQYVGEWHSHPTGCSNTPSNQDEIALRILTEILAQESLPAIAFILGKEKMPHVSIGWNP